MTALFACFVINLWNPLNICCLNALSCQRFGLSTCQLDHLVHPLPQSTIHFSLSLLSIEGPSAIDLLRKCIVFIWGIWKARNQWCFLDEKLNPSFVSSVAVDLIEEYVSALLPSVEGNHLSSPSSERSKTGTPFNCRLLLLFR